MKILSAMLLSILFLSSPTLLAQSSSGSALKELGLEELVAGGSGYAAYHTYPFTEPIWWGDRYIGISEDGETVFSADPKSNKKHMLFSFEKLNKVLEGAGLNKVYRLANLTFPTASEPFVRVKMENKGYALVDFKKAMLLSFIPVPAEANNCDFSEAAQAVAYTKGNNLFVATAQGERALTHEAEGIVCGQSVHRDEFGITKGTFWSLDGTKLAFYRMDETEVAQYPLLNINTRCAENQPIRYPMAGETSHKVTVGIYDLASKNILFLQMGDPSNRYFTNLSWAPNAKSIYLIELNRDQNDAQLIRYNVERGEKEKVLREEKHAKYVEPQHPIVFLPWNENQFIYQSECDGFDHYYLYNTEGKLLKQLTKGEWIVKKLIGFDKEHKDLIYSSSEGSPLQTNLYRLNLATSERTLLNPNKGVHVATISNSGRYLIDSYATPATPRRIELIDCVKQRATKLYEGSNLFAGCNMPSVEVGTLKAADKATDLYFRFTKPSNFDPKKQYPVIVYVYGGPHFQLITDTWMHAARDWELYMANRGYLIFTLDGRGSSGRGSDFEKCTFRQLGIEEAKDQMQGIAWLKSLPYVDSTRIGVHGWSFGGYMTTSLMLRHPETFKVGVAGGSVIDWKFYEVMYGERYMDTPETNPEGYKVTNLANLAKNLKGRLLMIEDLDDPVVVPQHTYTFLKACIEARTYPDYFTYPGHAHNVLGRDRIHLYEKISRYFDDFLK